MKIFVGLWKLDEPIYCKKDVSGKSFKSCIGGIDTTLYFPSCPEVILDNNSILKGDLIAPLNLKADKLNWGTIHEWPKGLFSVNALLCAWKDDENIADKIYEDFPRWKEKFNNLVLIDSGNFIQPKQKPISLLQYGRGIYDGLEITKIENGNIETEINTRKLEPIELKMVSEAQCYDTEKIATLFKNAGDSREINFPYELLIVAYRAVIRHDFRSAIVIAGTALEKSIIGKIEKFYNDNQLSNFEQNKDKHKMLGRKFKWLEELGIDIPIQDYKTEILHIRNSVAHEGKNHNYDDTITYLENCKLLIQEYSSNVLEN